MGCTRGRTEVCKADKKNKKYCADSTAENVQPQTLMIIVYTCTHTLIMLPVLTFLFTENLSPVFSLSIKTLIDFFCHVSLADIATNDFIVKA